MSLREPKDRIDLSASAFDPSVRMTWADGFGSKECLADLIVVAANNATCEGGLQPKTDRFFAPPRRKARTFFNGRPC